MEPANARAPWSRAYGGCTDRFRDFSPCQLRSGAIKANNAIEIWFSEGSRISLLLFASIPSTHPRGARSELNYSESSHFLPRADMHVIPANLWPISKQWDEDKEYPCQIEEAERNVTRATPSYHALHFPRLFCTRIIYFSFGKNIYLGSKNALVLQLV